jgi:hypothetical protein
LSGFIQSGGALGGFASAGFSILFGLPFRLDAAISQFFFDEFLPGQGGYVGRSWSRCCREQVRSAGSNPPRYWQAGIHQSSNGLQGVLMGQVCPSELMRVLSSA